MGYIDSQGNYYEGDRQYNIIDGELVWDAEVGIMPAPTKAQQIIELFNAYDTERRQLERYLNDAIATYQDEQYASEVRAKIIALDDKYLNDCEVINNG